MDRDLIERYRNERLSQLGELKQLEMAYGSDTYQKSLNHYIDCWMNYIEKLEDKLATNG